MTHQDTNIKIRKNVFTVAIFILNSWLTYYFTEAIYRKSFSSALTFLFQNQNIALHFLNFIIIMAFQLSVLLLTNHIGYSFGIISLITCILAIVNGFKMDARGEAFTFGDIAVAKEALLVANNYNLQLSSLNLRILILIFCISIALLVCLPPVFEKKKNSHIIRLSFGIANTILILLIWCNVENIIDSAGGNHYIFVVSSWYDENGFVLGLVRTAPRSMKAPDGYLKETVLTLQENVSQVNTKNFSESELPNIIFVMNESLYDIETLEGVSFSMDPLEKLKMLQKEYTYGNIISPAYGGGTCNVEFEVLTGYSMEWFESGGVLPYADAINKKLYSIVSLLNSHGYHTTNFHPNTGSYFNRRNVYQYMQFSELNFTEEMDKLPSEGIYPSDAALYKKVIQSFEENQSTDTPYFSYIITMQNHGGYNYQYNNYNINITENSRCKNEQALQTYANLEYSSIEAFLEFVEYFENISEPTIIVMFGDHSPNLGCFEYEFETTYVSGELKYKTTPLIVWSNYGLPYENWGYVNAYNLAAKVLNYANIEMDEFFLYSLAPENVPTYQNEYYINKTWMSGADVSEYAKYKQNLCILAYDRVLGKDYGNWENE